MPLFINKREVLTSSSVLSPNAHSVSNLLKSLFNTKIFRKLETSTMRSFVHQLILDWISAKLRREFKDADQMAKSIASVMSVPRSRENAFFQNNTENTNIERVIYQQDEVTDSVGWSQLSFFEQLGSVHHHLNSQLRNAEQEFLLQNMVKGALFEAAEIADKFDVGIAVRGTSILAHMGIESGSPTKAQEIKNKTSKDMDLFLCEELTFPEVGAVLHYDPRVGWHSSETATWHPAPLPGEDGFSEADFTAFVEREWRKKLSTIKTRALSDPLASLISKKSVEDYSQDDKAATLKKWFISRLREYAEEDHDFREGEYRKHVELVGPFVHLKARPNAHLYGDHDLFAFTKNQFGKLVHDSQVDLSTVQKKLQRSNTFQAQHGGIWNWRPRAEFHQQIKRVIMSAHSPPNGDPLVYILPHGIVVAAFYINDSDGERLVSAWDYPEAKAWLKTTRSGASV